MKTILGRLLCNVVGLVILLHWGCSEIKDSSQTVPHQLVQFAKSIENIEDIVIEGKDLHIHILIDSTNAGCDEQWNFKNGGFILKLAFSEQWRNYIDTNNYNVHIHRSFDFKRSGFKYVASYSSNDVINMSKRFLHPNLLEGEIDYVIANFSCEEYREMYLMLKIFGSDSLFVSSDTCFSQLYFNCRSNNDQSCEDIMQIRSMCDYALKDADDPVCASLKRHFTGMDSIRFK